VRLRHVCSVGSALLAFGAFASDALADSTPGATTAGGATAPVSSTPTGATGAIGATGATGVTGAAGPTATGDVTAPTPVLAPTPLSSPPMAPIVLGKEDQSATFVYRGPVYVETAAGATVPYVPHTMVASVSGGTIAGTPTGAMPHLVVPGTRAEIVHGLAAAPEGAPAVVQHIIWAANKIIGRPYVFGGGHRSFISFGYDCSGTVSFALHGGRLLKAPLDSGQFMQWGRSGQGQWLTILTNPGHAYLDVAGLRLDTSAADDPHDQQGPRWRPLRPANSGYTVRHPAGL
jgi:cell wall-associated NlpC family hydrolase